MKAIWNKIKFILGFVFLLTCVLVAGIAYAAHVQDVTFMQQAKTLAQLFGFIKPILTV